MTYDDIPAVSGMAGSHGFVTDLILMKNTHNRQMAELLIGRNLEWLYD